MNYVWKGEVRRGHGWAEDLGAAKITLHANGWLQVQLEPEDDISGEYPDASAAQREQVMEASLRRLLARQAHADTVAKAASQVLVADVRDTPQGVAESLQNTARALERLIRAVIDGPEPKGDSAHVEFKAYRPAIDLAREIIVKCGWPVREGLAYERNVPFRAADWLAQVINTVRGETPKAIVSLREDSANGPEPQIAVTTGDGGIVQIGDLWRSPFDNTFTVLSFDRPGHAILRNERLGHEDGVVVSRMTRENGWDLIRRAAPEPEAACASERGDIIPVNPDDPEAMERIRSRLVQRLGPEGMRIAAEMPAPTVHKV